MDRWSEFANTIDQSFPSNAPRPGQPGQGMGNRPYAAGLMSGQHGASPEARQLYGGMADQQRVGQAQASFGPQGPPAQQGGSGPGTAPPPQMNPQMQMQVLDYLMQMMMQRAQTGQKSPMSTTGTF